MISRVFLKDAVGKSASQQTWEVQFRKKLTFKKNFLFEFEIGNQNRPNSRSNGSKTKPNVLGNVKTPVRRRKRKFTYLNANSEFSEGKASLVLPIKTVSEANSSEPWFKRHGRHKDQQKVIGIFLNPHRDKIRLPCKIMLTRFAPDELDTFDNLPMSFKYIVDGICAIITGEMRAGKADSDKRISISCTQEKSSSYGIKIEITF